ncbi:IST1-like protein, partial [Linum perenne]
MNMNMMKKKLLEALLGRRSFRSSKFKTLANLVISRISYLEKQHKSRCSQARLDVSQLLHQRHLQRALQRVEYAMREQNMVDLYAMIDNYCHLLIERLVLIETTNSKECPDELKEAIASLIYAAGSCGELPELQEMKRLFTRRYGNEFTTRATDLRNNCGVHPRQPSLESKISALKEIAPNCELIPQLDDVVCSLHRTTPCKLEYPPSHHSALVAVDEPHMFESNGTIAATTSLSTKLVRTPSRRSHSERYLDFETAAHAACELAAQAAAAARAAMELSRPPSTYDSGQGSSGGGDCSSWDTNGDNNLALKLLRRSITSKYTDGYDVEGKSRNGVSFSSDYVPKLFKRSSSSTTVDTTMFSCHPPNIG